MSMINDRKKGLKEVADVVFIDLLTGRPAMFFDTLKVSTIENESESAEARGGQGNGKIMSWDFGRTATLTLQDALISQATLAMLAGTEIKKNNVTAFAKETLEVVEATGTPAKKVIKVANKPLNAGKTFIYKMEGGIITEELLVVDADIVADTAPATTATITISASTVNKGDKVMVAYEYVAKTGADNIVPSKVTFSGKKFPSSYEVWGSTITRDRQTQKDRAMQFHIGQAKLQSAFSLTMDVENVSVFDLTLDILQDANASGDMYDLIQL